MAIYLGIDPGKNGAFALIDSETFRVECIDALGTTGELHDVISSLPLIKMAWIEKPFYPKLIGIKNATTIAERYGILQGALQWRCIPFDTVRPRDWKAFFGLLKADKNASREKAMQIFPDDAAQFKRVKDHDRAEASLIAWRGMQHLRKGMKNGP